ncbi:hypothetical protein AX14_008440 [Amanita brunnescens Koide BX004]|nr:hypothetical protein AX14_008440 [Amanita brunnescens Koide BX004]
MEQKWNNPVYAAVLRKTRPAHLPSDVPFRQLRTHLVQEQFEHASDAQRPGHWVQDIYQSQITVDTSSPKKLAKTFKAWVENLQKDLQALQRVPDSIVIFTDGAYHHADHRAAYAYTYTTGDHTTWGNWTAAKGSRLSSMRSFRPHVRPPPMVRDMGRGCYSTRQTHGTRPLIRPRLDHRSLPHFSHWVARTYRQHPAPQGYSQHAPSRHDCPASFSRRKPCSLSHLDSPMASQKYRAS